VWIVTNAVAVVAEERGALAEQVAVIGDLAQLTPQQRMAYYSRVCESLGINPYTQPFQYIRLNNKLVLYATRTAADQLRKRNGVSLDAPDIQFADGLVIVTVTGRAADGRTDTEIGAVPLGNLQGEARANAIMKAVTKAKRRLTLSICGLGWLDETEVETIRDARPVTVTDDGEIVDEPPATPQPRPAQSTPPANGGQRPQAQPAQDTGPLSDEDTAISEANGNFANVAADFLGTDALTIKRRMGELKLSVPRTGQQRIEVYHALKADMGAVDDLMAVAGQPPLVTVDATQPGQEYRD
jgi:hypothetical protein